MSSIASNTGKPLFMDHEWYKKSVSFAKVCIEISTSIELPNVLYIAFNDIKDYVITFEYD